MVNIIGIVGSPRKGGNTEKLVKEALQSAENSGANTELINLNDSEIEPCTACDICKATGECAIYDDIPKILSKMVQADGIIIGSPVYFGNVTAQLKILIDRSRPLRIDFKLKNKVGGAISVGASRNGGQESTILSIHEFMLIQDMVIVGDGSPLAHYGGAGVGGPKGDAINDDHGKKTSKNLGIRVTQLAFQLNG